MTMVIVATQMKKRLVLFFFFIDLGISSLISNNLLSFCDTLHSADAETENKETDETY